MFAGSLPFESGSPYLGFLKIGRGVFGRSLGVGCDGVGESDDGWDLIKKLLKVDRGERIGAGAFEWVAPPNVEDEEEHDDKNKDGKNDNEDDDKFKPKKKHHPLGKVIEHGNGYDVIRKHPFFAKQPPTLVAQTNSHFNLASSKPPTEHATEPLTPIPSLRDLALRATTTFIDTSTLDINLDIIIIL